MNITEGKTIDIRKEFIEKACEWLKNNFVNGKEIGCDAGAMHKNFKSIEEIIPSFIKAMEEYS